jgi:hypothetical protein
MLLADPFLELIPPFLILLVLIVPILVLGPRVRGQSLAFSSPLTCCWAGGGGRGRRGRPSISVTTAAVAIPTR